MYFPNPYLCDDLTGAQPMCLYPRFNTCWLVDRFLQGKGIFP